MREILQYESVTRVPCVPARIRGVINVRGAVVPVVDLAVRFGVAETAITARTCVLMAETSVDGVAAVVGVIADEVSEVLELGPDEIVAAPSFGADARVAFLTGMGKVGKEFVLLLDLDALLSPEEAATALAAAGAGALVGEVAA